ncbi:MAG: twin transmembrane helix small protein [Rhodospirillaceae bacterium]|nr:twin transmembrane helix small protein [Rhodospirillaceae bacterium]MBT5939369.1 twin transmembrane helix small protein [Rhodospirillaceae bacterium]MBT7957602.1 twin transmembrane helix small protein [Rhodospirillaceae bacterium]
MSTFLNLVPILLLIAVIATAIVLFAGIISMANDKKFSPTFRNKMMRARVILQGIVIVLFLIMIFSSALAPGSG